MGWATHTAFAALPEWLGEFTQLRKIIIRRTPLKRKKNEAQLAAILPGCELE
jgi:hypothetical protein